MTRPAGWLSLAFALLIGPLPAEAQAPAKVWRVAVLTGAVPRAAVPPRALEERLAELGYVEGKNLVIDFRTAGGQLDRLPALAAELVGRRPDVFVAVSTQGAMAAKNATQTIPIVFGAVGDPLGTGIVPSLARPTRFDLLINLRAAKALGLTIPPALLLRADQVIDQ